MNWSAIKRFNFTYAIPGGAWLEDSTGYVNWESFSTIQKHLGQLWIDAQLKAQGWMTGCWIDVRPTNHYPGRSADDRQTAGMEVGS